MDESEARRYAGMLGRMAELEAAISAFYRACAGRCQDPGFWTGLSADEDRHAAYLREMAGIVLERQGKGFSPGRPFTADAVAKFIGYVGERTREVADGRMDGKMIASLANAIEKRLFADRYDEVLKTVDERYTALMAAIMSDTATHVEATARKMLSA